jgi:hypothetical protein
VSERCWHMMALEDEGRRCTNAARWQSPPWLADDSSFMRAVRWCDQHRHDNDVRTPGGNEGSDEET